MVTVIAGKPHDGRRSRIVSLSDAAGATNECEFEAGGRANVKPGEPKWANYMKGCIANFICESSVHRLKSRAIGFLGKPPILRYQFHISQ